MSVKGACILHAKLHAATVAADIGGHFAPKPVVEGRLGISVNNDFDKASFMRFNPGALNHPGRTAHRATGGASLHNPLGFNRGRVDVGFGFPFSEAGIFNPASVGATVPTDIKRTWNFFAALRARPGIFYSQSILGPVNVCRQRLFGDQFELFTFITAQDHVRFRAVRHIIQNRAAGAADFCGIGKRQRALRAAAHDMIPIRQIASTPL
jgi:hypothetical protein